MKVTIPSNTDIELFNEEGKKIGSVDCITLNAAIYSLQEEHGLEEYMPELVLHLRSTYPFLEEITLGGAQILAGAVIARCEEIEKKSDQLLD